MISYLKETCNNEKDNQEKISGLKKIVKFLTFGLSGKRTNREDVGILGFIQPNFCRHSEISINECRGKVFYNSSYKMALYDPNPSIVDNSNYDGICELGYISFIFMFF